MCYEAPRTEYRVETSPDVWIRTLRHSHDTLRAMVGPLTDDDLTQPAYPSEWSIAQVLSHLGSGAEIFGLFLQAGLAGAEPPGQDAFGPIWQAWNERGPRAQATDALAADEALVKRLESVSEAERARMRLHLFGMDTDVTGLTRMRLGEHAVHSWDIAVALDPAATIAAGAVNLLVDTLGQIAAWSGKAGGRTLTVAVTTTGPDRSFLLTAGDAVALEPAGRDGAPGGAAALALPAEALIRLVYGRLDPAHTPAVHADGISFDDLRPIFPGP